MEHKSVDRIPKTEDQPKLDSGLYSSNCVEAANHVDKSNGKTGKSVNGAGPPESSPPRADLPSTSCDKKSDLGKLGSSYSTNANLDNSAAAVHITNAAADEGVQKTERDISQKGEDPKVKAPEKPQRSSLGRKCDDDGLEDSGNAFPNANGCTQEGQNGKAETNMSCDKELSVKEARINGDEKERDYGESANKNEKKHLQDTGDKKITDAVEIRKSLTDDVATDSRREIKTSDVNSVDSSGTVERQKTSVTMDSGQNTDTLKSKSGDVNPTTTATAKTSTPAFPVDGSETSSRNSTDKKTPEKASESVSAGNKSDDEKASSKASSKSATSKTEGVKPETKASDQNTVPVVNTHDKLSTSVESKVVNSNIPEPSSCVNLTKEDKQTSHPDSPKPNVIPPLSTKTDTKLNSDTTTVIPKVEEKVKPDSSTNRSDVSGEPSSKHSIISDYLVIKTSDNRFTNIEQATSNTVKGMHKENSIKDNIQDTSKNSVDVSQNSKSSDVTLLSSIEAQNQNITSSSGPSDKQSVAGPELLKQTTVDEKLKPSEPNIPPTFNTSFNQPAIPSVEKPTESSLTPDFSQKVSANHPESDKPIGKENVLKPAQQETVSNSSNLSQDTTNKHTTPSEPSPIKTSFNTVLPSDVNSKTLCTESNIPGVPPEKFSAVTSKTSSSGKTVSISDNVSSIEPPQRNVLINQAPPDHISNIPPPTTTHDQKSENVSGISKSPEPPPTVSNDSKPLESTINKSPVPPKVERNTSEDKSLQPPSKESSLEKDSEKSSNGQSSSETQAKEMQQNNETSLENGETTSVLTTEEDDAQSLIKSIDSQAINSKSDVNVVIPEDKIEPVSEKQPSDPTITSKKSSESSESISKTPEPSQLNQNAKIESCSEKLMSDQTVTTKKNTEPSESISKTPEPSDWKQKEVDATSVQHSTCIVNDSHQQQESKPEIVQQEPPKNQQNSAAEVTSHETAEPPHDVIEKDHVPKKQPMTEKETTISKNPEKVSDNLTKNVVNETDIQAETTSDIKSNTTMKEVSEDVTVKTESIETTEPEVKETTRGEATNVSKTEAVSPEMAEEKDGEEAVKTDETKRDDKSLTTEAVENVELAENEDSGGQTDRPTEEDVPKVEDEAPEEGGKTEEAVSQEEVLEKTSDNKSVEKVEPEGGSNKTNGLEPQTQLEGSSKKVVSLDASEIEKNEKKESRSARSSPVKSRYRYTRERSPDKAQRGVPKTLFTKDRTTTPDSKKSEKGLSSPRKSASGESSPKKSLTPRNGVPSPSKSGRTPSSEPPKKIPPIKAPVGQVPPPNVKNVKSKIGSLDNIKYKPGGGDKKVTSKRLDWKVEPKVGSMENATHKPGGGDKKIQTVKVEFKEKAAPKVGSKDLIKHQPGGGNIKVSKPDSAASVSSANRVETQKLEFKDKAAPKVGSLDNVKHKAGGGNIQVKTEKLNFKEKATAKVGSLGGSDKGSNHGSNPQSPIPVLSPVPNDSSHEIPPVAENAAPPIEAINGDESTAIVANNVAAAKINGEEGIGQPDTVAC